MQIDNLKGELTKTPFNIITQSDILTKADIDSLIPLTKELEITFKKTQAFRTRTEMEVSVLNDIKFPTHSSKYWQSMREQNVMFHELVMLSYEYRKNIVEIKKLKRDLLLEKDDLDKELLQIEIEKKAFVSKNQERTAKARIEEIKMWSEIKERESKEMSEKELSTVDNHQLISYVKRWIQQSIIMDKSGSPSERHNLLGQLNSGINLCIEKGIINDVLKDMSKSVNKQIKLKYNL